MGQSVVIKRSLTAGDVLLVDTDRSFTGQDGEVVTPDRSGKGVPAKLGDSVFSLGIGVDHVHVLQNQVSLRRPGGWDDDAVREVETVIEGFLEYYQ